MPTFLIDSMTKFKVDGEHKKHNGGMLWKMVKGCDFYKVIVFYIQQDLNQYQNTQYKKSYLVTFGDYKL